MIRKILATGLAAAMLLAPAAAMAQQAGDSVETYSDTLPRHHSTVKRQIALKTSAKKTGSKGHKGGKSHTSGKGRHGKKSAMG